MRKPANTKMQSTKTQNCEKGPNSANPFLLSLHLTVTDMSMSVFFYTHRPQWDRFPARLDTNVTAQLHRLASELENCTKKLGM